MGVLDRPEFEECQVAIPPKPVEVQPGNPRQPFPRIDDAVQSLPTSSQGIAHRPLEERHQQVVLAAEVEVDGAGSDAGGAGDVRHL